MTSKKKVKRVYQYDLFGGKTPLDEIKIKRRLEEQAAMIEKATEKDPDDYHAMLCPWVPEEEWAKFMEMIERDGFSYREFDELGMHYLFDLFDKFAHIITCFKHLKFKRFLYW